MAMGDVFEGLLVVVISSFKSSFAASDVRFWQEVSAYRCFIHHTFLQTFTIQRASFFLTTIATFILFFDFLRVIFSAEAISMGLYK